MSKHHPGLPEGPETTNAFMQIYEVLEAALGDLKWWPADTPEEVVIGAILVQSVSWSNTERAILNLREQGLLTWSNIHSAPLETLERCIVPTLYFRMKAKKLKAFASHICHRYHGNMNDMFSQQTESLRQELLSIYGIGPETADDIILYAAKQPSFVVDTFTKRILHRFGLSSSDVPYETMRQWFMRHLPNDVRLFNQFHALFDHVGHHYCLAKRPLCHCCPLDSYCSKRL